MAANLHLFKSHLRRKRFAFAVTPRWKGANIDAAEAPLRSANPDKARACCFSSTILAHSVGEHLPCASIQLLRAIVSNEENIISVIIAGSRTAFRRLVFFIKRDFGRSRFFSQVGVRFGQKEPKRENFCPFPISVLAVFSASILSRFKKLMGMQVDFCEKTEILLEM